MAAPPARWFDAHLDLACIAENGRDMAAPLDRCGGPADPAITFPSLSEGRVSACLATVFTEPDGDDAVAYPAGDAEAAHAAGVRQIAWYQRWQKAGLMSLDLHSAGGAPLLAGILIEGADPVRSPDELSWWRDRGAIAIGLAWARPSRYSGGNMTPTQGLTDLGREIIPVIDELKLTHDVSHLSDVGMDELFSRTQAPVIASHSNCRALLDPDNQRHLRDESIREIARRGGVIGLNLYGKFIDRPGRPAGSATIPDAIAHIEHTCEVVGHRRAVGLGSDMDGGFGAAAMPAGIRSPIDLAGLADALAARGWSHSEVADFAWGNWARFWRLSDPDA